MHEQEVTIQSGGAVLIGTMCTPDVKGKFPAVLMVHGSGPLDRNENMKGQELNIFNTIALVLVEHGIASLRYDKRGCGRSSGDFMTAGHADLVQDAAQCLDALARSESVDEDQLFILGHSEGCIIAPQIAHHRPGVAGLVLLCPFIERFESVLIRQTALIEKEVDSLPGIAGVFYRTLFRIVGKPRATQPRLIRKVRATDSPVVRAWLSRHPAKWIREMLDLDTDAIFASTRTPMLLIAGGKDLQCNPQDIFRIAETSQSQTETMLIEGMTHLLRIDKNPATIMGAARLIGEPLEPVVIERALHWIHVTSAANNQLHAISSADA
jgi:alpha-beta hydrolase superfamily lysophospholipase